MGMKWIHKIGAAVISNDRLLVVRKRGLAAYILPGGKPEPGETDLETLSREVKEELGCGFSRPVLVGKFKDVAAGTGDAVVVVTLYTAALVGEPTPSNEIEGTAWIPLRGAVEVELAPSIERGILPALRRRLKQGGSGEPVEHDLQGAFQLV